MNPQLLNPKRSSFLILFLGIYCICNAQLHPLITENKIWSNLVTEYSAKKSYPLIASHFIKAVEVRSVDGIYNSCKLIRSDKEDMSVWYDYGTLEEYDQKVFYVDAFGLHGLLYDFSVEKGDTVQVYDGPKIRFYQYPELVDYRVDSIDTISILGVERKRILLEGHNIFGEPVEETWISGIGSLSGILFNNSCLVGCDASILLCLIQGDSLLYGNRDIGDCFYSNHVGIPDVSKAHNQVEVYPNPVKNLLHIGSEISNYLSIEITSLNGKRLFNQTLEGRVHKIDLSSFQKGVYFITIRSNDFVATRKVIKL